MTNRFLVQVTSPHFTAGLISDHEKVVKAAPILAWTKKGYTINDLIGYFKHKGWEYSLISEWEE